MEYIVLGAFCITLIVSLIIDLNLIYALLIGLAIFFVYAFKKGFTIKDIVKMSFSGIKTVKNILLIFILIGVITALWRASGTIAVIVTMSTKLISPSIFLLMTFLLNCLISTLTGTAFGTAATIGVICSTIAATIGISPTLTGGAVVAGAYFGDRCSPVSTSALLIATITGTNIFSNIKKMLKTALIPFIISCGIYTVIGLLSDNNGIVPDMNKVFAQEFDLSIVAVVPAVILIFLTLFRLNVKIVMLGGIVSAFLVCLFIQNISFTEILKFSFFGYTAKTADIASMINGGGILSMLRVSMIILISSAYSGVFKETGLLDNIKKATKKLSCATTPFISTLLTSIVSGMVACNQTLTIMLCEQLCGETEKNKQKLAIILENSAVVIAPLIPWSIAGAVPLASIGAPTESLLFAFFLYLLPICEAVSSLIKRNNTEQKNHCN